MDSEEFFDTIGKVLSFALGIGIFVYMWINMDEQSGGSLRFPSNPLSEINIFERLRLINPDSRTTQKQDQKLKVSAMGDIPYTYPVKGQFSISSGFGYRPDPFHGRRTFHRGIDIPLRTGTPVYATGKGRVTEAGYHRGLGNYIKIRHGDGYESMYAHLSRIHVKRGQTIESGQHIGNSGNTGRSTGPHLHYQVNFNGKAIDPVELVNRFSTAQSK